MFVSSTKFRHNNYRQPQIRLRPFKSATEFCFLECQEIKEFPRKWHVPLVLFRSTLQPAKSTSEYLIRSNDVNLYHKPISIVPVRYLKMRLTALKWDSLGQDWNLAHRHTENMISGLEAVKYKRLPIIPLYSFSHTFFPFSSLSNFKVVLMGVGLVLQFSNLNLFKSSLVYLDWFMKVPWLVCFTWRPKK